ncbi:GspH/FimT family pseudopilin [Litoreibacter roseus]|uniref:Type II secretion system protein H n=1 Tax=Litoreibacter roseus TaxID=2601869 RepID=A0A6N6JMQ4_9RHOB|nr:GspH/FimT family pseudopilin [Litoreibacter roseus]GFE66492.1 hypothetical protein KIN_35660 [Litoreibacter roseus]
MTRRRRRGQGGFATLEVLVTVAVVLLVGTVSIFAMGQSDGARLRADAAAIALMLQQARLEAVESGKPVSVEYSKDTRSLVTARSQHTLSRGVDSDSPSRRVTIRPSGESRGFAISLKAGPRTQTVHLDWLTGRVQVTQ